MFARMILAPLVLVMGTACNSYSTYERYEPKSKGLNKAALLLEGNDPNAAQQELLKLVPGPARLLLETTEVPETLAYVTDLSAAMTGVDQGPEILSMYATSEAAITDVGTLNIIIELVKIDKEKKSAQLTLTETSDDDAIALFFPAMPLVCRSDFAKVHRGLDKAIAIMLTVSALIKNASSTQEVIDSIATLRAALSKPNLLNQSVFSLVNFICPILQFDSSQDFVVDDAEAAAISTDDATGLYTRMDQAIASIQAMVDANPGDKNLEKALARCQLYKTKVDSLPAELSLADKVRAFLVSQTKKG